MVVLYGICTTTQNRANYNSLTSDICQVSITDCQVKFADAIDQFCIVCDHAKLKDCSNRSGSYDPGI